MCIRDSVEVNGRMAGAWTASASWSESEVAVPAAFWRREINEVVFEGGAGPVMVDAVSFERMADRSAHAVAVR